MTFKTDSEKYSIEGYEVTDDIGVLYDHYGLTPEMFWALEKVEKAATAGRSSGYEKIARAIRKYPQMPFFKDMMVTYYLKREEEENADNMLQRLCREHPDFIPGVVSMAMVYFEREEFDKITEILGKNFDLKDLNPGRDVFWIDEFVNLQYAATMYFEMTGQSQKATERLDLMEQIAPDSELTQMVRLVLTQLTLENSTDDFWDEVDNNFSGVGNFMGKHRGPEIPRQRMTRKKKQPGLNHSESIMLYFYGLDIPAEEVEKLLNLPRESLIEDLETLLNDSIARYSFLTEGVEPLVDPEFVTHLIFLLAEVDSKASAPLIYRVLSQSSEYFDYFLLTIFRYDAYGPFYKLLAHDPKAMVAFIKKPAIPTMPRIMVLELLREIVNQKPAEKFEILACFDEIIDFFLKSKAKDNVQDNMLMDALIINLSILHADQFMPKVKQLVHRGLTMHFDDTPIEDIATGMHRDLDPEDDIPMLPNRSMMDTYRHLIEQIDDQWDDDEWDDWDDTNQDADEWNNYGEFDDGDDFPDDAPVSGAFNGTGGWGNTGSDRYQSNMKVVKSPKIGRNEPCPCGSGKKYKKCCLGNEER